VITCHRQPRYRVPNPTFLSMPAKYLISKGQQSTVKDKYGYLTSRYADSGRMQ
jgi:hypothetical protein